ncbi:putative ADP-ribosylation factor-binding protein C25H2.16c [Schizosaccharomyces pombe]
MSSAKRRLYSLIQNATEPYAFEPDLAVNLDIADLINQTGGNLPREAAFAIVRKVNDRNPTVAYLALNLLDICVKNCGYAFRLQIASKEFLNELVRRFPERPPSRLNKIQVMILSLIEEWRKTICRVDRYKEDLGFIRDMHRLLSYKGYTFPEIDKENLAVLSQKSVLKTAEELEKEDREAMSAKLQELIRRGTPADLAEANKLMKVMAGYDTEQKQKYKEHVLVDLEKVKRKAALFGEMLNEVSESDKLASGDLYDELAYSLKAAQRKVDKILEEMSPEDDSYVTVSDLKSLIASLLTQYDHLLEGDFSSARTVAADNNSLLQATTESAKSNSKTSANASNTQSAMDLLIDLDIGSDAQSPSLPASSSQMPTSSFNMESLSQSLLGTVEAPAEVGAISLTESFNSPVSNSSPNVPVNNFTSTCAFENSHLNFQITPKSKTRDQVVLLATYTNLSPYDTVENLQSFIAVPKKYNLVLQPQSGTNLSPLQKDGIYQEMIVTKLLDVTELPVRFKLTYKVNGRSQEYTGQSSIRLL